MRQLAQLPQLLARRDWKAAEALLRKAAVAGAPAAVFYNLAKVLEMRGKTADIAPWLEKAVAADPRHPNAWFELGRARMDLNGDLPGAEAAFSRAVDLEPDDADAWRNLARLRLRLGNWAGCAEALVHLPEDAETLPMAYRVACERSEDTEALRARLLSDRALRPAALKALTRVAKGQLPLRLPQAR